MSGWRPRLNPSADLRSLTLSPEEGFVLSRLDGSTDVAQLPALTGLAAEKLDGILARLVETGAVLPGATPEPAAPEPAAPEPAAPEPAAPEPEVDLSEPIAADDAVAEASAQVDDSVASPEADKEIPEGNHRQLFEEKLHPLPPNERVARAPSEQDPLLTALCFDPVAAVIAALVTNPRFGPMHARLVARHHRTPSGLEALASKAAFAADAGVRRWIVRNPQLPARLARRLFTSQRMLVHHKLSVERDLPEQTRRLMRELLRQRFATGPAEERVELIFKTEGRCLAALTGIPVDGKTTSLLCGRPYASSLLVQNIARWSAAPPALIAHLLKQDVVKRQPQLRALLARHPNAPAESKKG